MHLLHGLGRSLKRGSSFFQAHLRHNVGQVSEIEQDNPHSNLFSICTIFNAPRAEINIAEWLPEVLTPYRDHVYADSLWNAEIAEAQAPAHAQMGLDESSGGIVVVRPDGHVGCSIQLRSGSDSADALGDYFNSFSPTSSK